MYQNKETDTMTSSKGSDICPTCHGSGYIAVSKATPKSIATYGEPVEVDYVEKCPTCNGGHENRVKDIKSFSYIPHAYYDKRLDSFKWDIYEDSEGKRLNLSKLKSYIDSFINDFEKWEAQGYGLYIWSHMRGSGKTFLASCICNELINRYAITTKFVSANKLIEIDKSGSDRGAGAPDQIEALCKCRLLVIDDLGQNTSGNSWLNDILFRITDSRLQNGLVTIVTSNIKLSELPMDDRIVDRLYKMCQPIPLPEYAIRQREANYNRRAFLSKMGLIGEGA